MHEFYLAHIARSAAVLRYYWVLRTSTRLKSMLVDIRLAYQLGGWFTPIFKLFRLCNLGLNQSIVKVAWFAV